MSIYSVGEQARTLGARATAAAPRRERPRTVRSRAARRAHIAAIGVGGRRVEGPKRVGPHGRGRMRRHERGDREERGEHERKRRGAAQFCRHCRAQRTPPATAKASSALCAMPVGRCARPSQSTATSSVPANATILTADARAQRAPHRRGVRDDQVVLVKEARHERRERGERGKSRERVGDSEGDHDRGGYRVIATAAPATVAHHWVAPKPYAIAAGAELDRVRHRSAPPCAASVARMPSGHARPAASAPSA